MTNQQQAQLLIKQLNDKNLELVLQFMTDLLCQEQEGKTSLQKRTESEKKELLEEFKMLLEKSRNCPPIDPESASEAAMLEKYGEFMKP